jgi:hypothetical protein
MVTLRRLLLMKKTILFLLVCVLALTGCQKALNEALSSMGLDGASSEEEGGGDRAENAVKVNKETRYYNDFLGFSYAIPKNWWLYEINGENISDSKGDITDDVSMAIGYGDYHGKSYASLWFLSFGNLQSDGSDSHLGFELDARSIKGANTMASYMDYFEEYMLEPTDDADYEMIDSQKITINGTPFELRDYLVDRKDDDFQVLTLTCGVKEGYFLNLIVDYWPENTKARQSIIDSITKSLEFF